MSKTNKKQNKRSEKFIHQLHFFKNYCK